MNPQLLINRLKQYPLVLVCAVVVLLGIAVIVLRGGGIAKLQSTEAELTTRLRTMTRNTFNANGLEEEVEQLEAVVAGIAPRLFQPSERAINTNFFYSFENRLDVLIAGVTQLPSDDSILGKGGPQELNLYSVLVYEISVSGTFHQILSFLHALHVAEPLIRVADFQLNEVSLKDEESGQLNARLRVLVLAEKD